MLSKYDIPFPHPVSYTHLSLGSIHGLGDKRIEQYGNIILKIIQEYGEKNDLKPKHVMWEVEPAAKSLPKGETQKLSLELFKKGMSMTEIAQSRGVTLSTIENHMATFVKSGTIDISHLIPEYKLLSLQKHILNHPGHRSKEIKAVSYTHLDVYKRQF